MTDTSGPYVGDRIVVRHRVDARRLTDVTGLLLDADDPLVIEGTGPKDRGERVSVRRDDVTSIRLLSYTTVRNSEIRSLAAALATAGAVHTESRAGWLLRSGNVAPLDNSAVPVDLDAHADGESLTAIARWYADRDLPALLAIPERLVPDGHITGTRVGPPMHVLVLPDDPSEAVIVDATDRVRGTELRARGYRLHHVLRHFRLE